MATAHAPRSGGLARAWRNFRRWRRARPFWGGLLQVLSGAELFLSGNMSLGALSVHFGPTGFLSYVIPAMLILCGVMTWVSPTQRLFYGIVGSLVAVYSLIGLNFGGFMVGLLLGIIGGALAVAWSPVQAATPDAAGPVVDEEPQDETESSWLLGENADPRPRYDHGQPYDDAPVSSAAQTYDGAQVPADEQRGDRVYSRGPEAAETAEIPRQVQDPDRWWAKTEAGARPGDEEPPPHGGDSSGYRSRMLAITLVPATLAAVTLFAVNDAKPAYAAPCPTPSLSAAAAGSATPKTVPSKAANQANKPGTTPPSQNGTPNPTQPTPGTSPSPAPPATGTGNPLVDGWNDFVGGVKRFFGGGDKATPAPAPSDSASPSPSGSPSTRPGAPNKPVAPAPSGAVPDQPPVSASASASSVPCAGPGVAKSAVLPPGIPVISDENAVLTGTRLVMLNSTFDGVTELTTSTGRKVKVLQFSMGQSDTSQFQLKIKENNGKSTVITSDLLITKSTDPMTLRTVKFFSPRFEGKLLGAIPMTFTPDSLPPTTPSFIPLIFTDVTIELAFVRSDILTASNMLVREA